MEAAAAGVKVVTPADGREGFLGSIGVRFMVDGLEAGERFSLVEHPMSARALAAPLHRHTREDEYSFVLEGRMGALLGDDVVRSRARRPRVQAAQPVAHLLERRRRAVPNPRDHLAGRLRALLPGALRPRRRGRRRTRRPSGSSASATAWRCGRSRSPTCSSASGCSWASRSAAAGGREPYRAACPR